MNKLKLILSIIILVMCLSSIIVYCWAFYYYKDTPINELPTWIWWFLNK